MIPELVQAYITFDSLPPSPYQARQEFRRKQRFSYMIKLIFFIMFMMYAFTFWAIFSYKGK